MPSAANAKSEKPASSEATDNSPVRQIITVLEHKIRNLEKRKGKLTQYRDLQKAGKELNSDQRVAVAKYDEVVQTLEFARDMAKQIASIAAAAEKDAKKQAKKDAWVRSATETSKIREVLLILDCLTQMGNAEAREDFLNGTNGAAKLTEEDLKILDDLYPEVTPKHEPNEEGQPGFHAHTAKAAEHLCSIIDGKPKEILGTTYTRIKEIVGTVHECGYFDQIAVETVVEVEQVAPVCEEPVAEPEPEPVTAPEPAYPLPVPPAPAVVPPPAYPLRAHPPITLQEVEHAYFAQQYPQQRPITEVIGSQNFFFLQESEIDSPTGTPQPAGGQPSPPDPIPTQTFTNQQFVVHAGRGPEGALPLPPQPHFPPRPEHAAFPPGVPLALPHRPVLGAPHHAQPVHLPPHAVPSAPPAPAPPTMSPVHAPPTMSPAHAPAPAPAPVPAPAPAPASHNQNENRLPVSPAENKTDDDWAESGSPERDEGGERKTHGQGDGQARYRRGFGRGGGGGRGAPNGYRGGRGSYQGRQGGDGYRGRHAGDYQGRPAKEEGGYRGRQHDGYQGRQKDSYHNRNHDDGYYGNGDAEHGENGGGRERYADNNQSYQGGFKSRGRGGPRGARGGPRPPRAHHYAASSRHNNKQESAE